MFRRHVLYTLSYRGERAVTESRTQSSALPRPRANRYHFDGKLILPVYAQDVSVLRLLVGADRPLSRIGSMLTSRRITPYTRRDSNPRYLPRQGSVLAAELLVRSAWEIRTPFSELRTRRTKPSVRMRQDQIANSLGIEPSSYGLTDRRTHQRC